LEPFLRGPKIAYLRCFTNITPVALYMCVYSGLRPSPSVAAVNEKFLSRFGGSKVLGAGKVFFIKQQMDYVRQSHFCANFLCLFHLIQEMSRKGEYFCPNGATRTPKYE
jgi:hypothetical protein